MFKKKQNASLSIFHVKDEDYVCLSYSQSTSFAGQPLTQRSGEHLRSEKFGINIFLKSINQFHSCLPGGNSASGWISSWEDPCDTRDGRWPPSRTGGPWGTAPVASSPWACSWTPASSSSSSCPSAACAGHPENGGTLLLVNSFCVSGPDSLNPDPDPAF